MFYVYKITNLITSRVYFGYTKTLQLRWRQHKILGGSKDNSKNYVLYNSMKKHGVNSFTFIAVGEFPTEQQALNAEMALIALYKSNCREFGYNMTIGGEGSNGYVPSLEQRQHHSQVMKGKFAGNKHPMYGKNHSLETRKAQSKLMTGRYTKEKNPFWGRKHSKEFINARSGEGNPCAKLTKDCVISIRADFDNGMKIPELSEKYKIHRRTISDIVRRVTWRNI